MEGSFHIVSEFVFCLLELIIVMNIVLISVKTSK